MLRAPAACWAFVMDCNENVCGYANFQFELQEFALKIGFQSVH